MMLRECRLCANWLQNKADNVDNVAEEVQSETENAIEGVQAEIENDVEGVQYRVNLMPNLELKMLRIEWRKERGEKSSYEEQSEASHILGKHKVQTETEDETIVILEDAKNGSY
ncbi:unnamed protein product [Rhodiola kirilowii]